MRRAGKIVCVRQNYRSHLTEMKDGDVVEVSVEGIGTLRNPVATG